ncbi:MAG: DUF1343 domain-containing protein [Candidatus Abyssobacteria bacterium SURF_5]|uniref:DUF1343 domain-containing protein n=1 Tax=Abyssobacteria bacterium (strain SURF_5) TaxID=2093360 RepID=A0A3A4NSB0_ABYX5|nr:MAG: DUF1343 domain-containing protein [Candidatus Abyssubacteria bacterium SURF_5]
MHTAQPVTLGVSRLLQYERKLLEGAHVGLIANSAARNEKGVPTAAALIGNGINLKCIFAPEHGYDVSAPPGQHLADSIEPGSGLPIRSLYGSAKEPTGEMLRDVDALVFDLQDIGVRCYTYIWTMALGMRAAAMYGKLFVVLDRPNPLGGITIQGPVLDPRFASFLGLYPIPLRHGMTAGELALLFNKAFGVGAHLAVVKMHGWRRRLLFSDTGLAWTAPSPAIVSPETALLYAGTCLFEGVNLSEGRGTSSPFRLIGSPWLDPAIVNKLDPKTMAGFAVSPQRFTPAASKYSGRECAGIALAAVDKNAADPIALAVELLSKITARHSRELQWNEQHFDALAGTDSLRKDILAGQTTEEILGGWVKDQREFEALRGPYLLYEG